MFAPAQILVLAVAAPWIAVPSAETPSDREDEPIVIRADRAWEAAAEDGGDSGAQVLHLQGDFEMRSANWQVTADSAEVRGPMQDPEQLVVIGAPARIEFTDDGDTATGEGRRIVYWRQREVLELHGDATLEFGELSLSSSKIVYDLEADRLQSSGDDGIQFTFSEKASDEED